MTIKLPEKLYKTTIVIWSEFDPELNMELEELAYQATTGDAHCSKMETKYTDPRKDSDWDETEFFGTDDDNIED